MGSVDVFELRQYTLKAGGRDVLVPLFDAHFVESQEEWGAHIVGQFEDLDDANRYVWLRGFPNMTVRLRALEGFYTGAVWKAHSAVANATMVDVSNVHLLRPMFVGSDFPTLGTSRDGIPNGGVIYVGISPHNASAAPLTGVLATFTTLHEANDFPALPVRDDMVDVWIARKADAAPANHVLRLRPTPRSQMR